MSIEITLDIFSGRENPHWVLSDDKEKDLLKQIDKIKIPTLSKTTAAVGLLGYRGITVKRADDHPRGGFRMLVHEGIVDFGRTEESLISNNRDLEQWLLETAPIKLESSVKSYLKKELTKPSSDVTSFLENRMAGLGPACPVCKASDAPKYYPDMWNIPLVQRNNNCYNYASDMLTNTFAQPGRAHGQEAAKMACQDVRAAARADGSVATDKFSTKLSAGKGWYIALVVWPGVDYHWYRQDKTGCWSHKPGPGRARNTDDSGKAITNPKTCDRGPYTNFCTFRITKKGVLII